MELDFHYPSEGIHQRWEQGYRITATAATPDQAAFILSIPRRTPVDESQETLRTTTFPATHVKVGPPTTLITPIHHPSNMLTESGSLQEKWEKNLFIASVCYGRTVS